MDETTEMPLTNEVCAKARFLHWSCGLVFTWNPLVQKIKYSQQRNHINCTIPNSKYKQATSPHILFNCIASHKQACVKARFLHWSCVMLSAHASDETHLVVWYLGEAIIGKGGFILVAPQLGFSMADHSNLFYFHFICLEHSPGANVNQKWLTVHQQLYTKKCLKKSFNVVCIVNKQKTEGFHSIKIDFPSWGQFFLWKRRQGTG